MNTCTEMNAFAKCVENTFCFPAFFICMLYSVYHIHLYNSTCIMVSRHARIVAIFRSFFVYKNVRTHLFFVPIETDIRYTKWNFSQFSRCLVKLASYDSHSSSFSEPSASTYNMFAMYELVYIYRYTVCMCSTAEVGEKLGEIGTPLSLSAVFGFGDRFKLSWLQKKAVREYPASQAVC